MSDEDRNIYRAWVNPLAFHVAEPPWADSSHLPSPEDCLDYLCTPGERSDPAGLAERYRQISVEPKRIVAPPAEQTLLGRLVWPLRHAKGSYMVGNYLGTIALCGMVAEMAAILYFELATKSPGTSAMPEATQESLFGNTFEKLGQERRVNVLKTLGLVNEDQERRFDMVRQLRRKYLHFYSHSHDSIAADSVRAYENVAVIVADLLGQDLTDDGRIKINPVLLKYLRNEKRQGELESSEGAGGVQVS